MIKSIIKDQFFLKIKSVDATIEDKEVIQNLKDTLKAHKKECVGMAANMIGVNKNIIAIQEKNLYVMINPVIKERFGLPYDTEEGCLSLKGMRTTKRYNKITITYLDENFRPKTKTAVGFEAQIIQHEIDHLNGIII